MNPDARMALLQLRQALDDRVVDVDLAAVLGLRYLEAHDGTAIEARETAHLRGASSPTSATSVSFTNRPEPVGMFMSRSCADRLHQNE